MRYWLIAFIVLAGTAQAQTRAVEFGYLGTRHPGDPIEGALFPLVDLGAISLRYGHGLTPWLTAEGAASLGITEDDDALLFDGFTLGYATKYEHGLMANLKFHTPVAGRFSLHGLIGYHSTTLSVEALNESVSETVSEALYGIGGEVRLFSNSWLRVEYMQEFDEDSDVDMYRLAWSQRF